MDPVEFGAGASTESMPHRSRQRVCRPASVKAHRAVLGITPKSGNNLERVLTKFDFFSSTYVSVKNRILMTPSPKKS